MATGKSALISRIKAGQKVMAANPVTGKTTAERVIATIITRTDKDFTAVTVKADGSGGRAVLISTSRHWYWVSSTRSWTDAGSLHRGDRLRTLSGQPATVTAVRNYLGHAITYNLTVANLHTYYVVAGSVSVLVHNSGGAGPCQVGALGEKAVQQVMKMDKNTTKFIEGTRTRYPDLFAPGYFIGEVKNVAELYLSSQIKDDIAIAAKGNLTFMLWIRSNTYLTPQLKAAIAQYNIQVFTIPGT